MGKIILKIPKKVKLEYQINDVNEAENLIKRFEKLNKSKKKKRSLKDNEQIIGIWKNRFPINKSSVQIAKELRKKAWTRF